MVSCVFKHAGLCWGALSTQAHCDSLGNVAGGELCMPCLCYTFLVRRACSWGNPRQPQQSQREPIYLW